MSARKAKMVLGIEHVAQSDKVLAEALPRVLLTAVRPEARGQVAREEENTVQWQWYQRASQAQEAPR